MVLTPSNMMPLGTKAPEFSLFDTVSGNRLNLDSLRGQLGTLIMFICNHCPYVKHVQEELARIGNEYPAKGINVVAISSNDVDNYPDDSSENMKIIAQSMNYNFPYLYDESQEVAKAYDATCTPDFFLFDKDLICVYRGQLDGSRPGNEIPVTGSDLRQALDAIINNSQVSPNQKPSIGCNIKWKS